MLESAFAKSNEISLEERRRLESYANANAMIYQEIQRMKLLTINENVAHQFIKLSDVDRDAFKSPSTDRVLMTKSQEEPQNSG